MSLKVLQTDIYTNFSILKVSDLLEYNVYVLYMDPLNLEEDHFFNSVSKMLNPTDIIRHGYKVSYWLLLDHGLSKEL